LPTNPSFAGHQTFAFRAGWLKKGLDALQDISVGGPSFFSRDDALVTLGVGKNMVQSIRHWLLMSGVAEDAPGTRGRELYPSKLGKALFGGPDNEGWDPYLEDIATLWLLHWGLAAPAGKAYSWVWTFNVHREYEFSRESLVESVISALPESYRESKSWGTIARDIDCLLHTYVTPERKAGADDEIDCPLQQLHLIEPCYARHFRFQLGPKPSLPNYIFYYAMLCFWQWRQGDSTALSVWDLTYAEGSPGMVFKLDEDSILSYLDDIEPLTEGKYSFQDTALVRQVLRHDTGPIEPFAFLKSYYEHASH